MHCVFPVVPSSTGQHGFYISYSVSGSNLYTLIRVETGTTYRYKYMYIQHSTWIHLAINYLHTG